MNIKFIVPNYRGTDLLSQCLESLRKYHPDNEVLVVDDGSSRDIQDACETICRKYNAGFVKSHWNNGYSHTVNRGLDKLDADILVMVNNDIVFKCNIEKEINTVFSKDPKIGVLGFLLFYPDGSIQHGGVERHNLSDVIHTEHHYPLGHAKKSFQSRYSIAVTGALMAVRKTMLDEIGVFKTSYKMAFEDVEFCFRAWHCGWRVYYSSGVKVLHLEGATRGTTPEEKKALGTWDNETISLIQYKKDVDSFYLNEIDNRVKSLNETDETVKFIRTRALGDVILTTGIINEYKRRNPQVKIYVQTDMPEPFMGNPNVFKTISTKDNLKCNKVFDLDWAYEKNPKISRVRAYADVVFKDYKWNDVLPKLYWTSIGFPMIKDTIIIHPAATRPNRTITKEVWDEVIDLLIKDGHNVAMVGTEKDIQPTPREGFTNLSYKHNLYEIHDIIKYAKAFVGIDSGMLHIAQCTDTPIVGIFSIAHPSTVIWRAEKTKVIIPKSECAFCLTYKLKPPVSMVTCEKQNDECIKSITAQNIIDGVREVLK